MDWGYVAGYFDGEGHVWCGRPAGRGSIKVEIAWHNTHRESLEGIRAFIGCGHIRARSGHGRTKDCYSLCVGRRSELMAVIDAMIPHCIIKRERLEVARSRLEVQKDRTPAWGNLSAAGVAEIQRLYQDEHWTQQRIGDHFGVGQSAVKAFMKRNGIQARSHAAAAREAQRSSLAWQERNRKISEARKREWADPEFRERRLARIRSEEEQAKRVAARQRSRAERGSW